MLVGDAVFSMSRDEQRTVFLGRRQDRQDAVDVERRARPATRRSSGPADLLFVLKDDGELMVARSTPGGFEPLKTYTVADSATWPAPSISGNRIFVRDLSYDRVVDRELIPACT